MAVASGWWDQIHVRELHTRLHRARRTSVHQIGIVGEYRLGNRQLRDHAVRTGAANAAAALGERVRVRARQARRRVRRVVEDLRVQLGAQVFLAVMIVIVVASVLLSVETVAVVALSAVMEVVVVRAERQCSKRSRRDGRRFGADRRSRAVGGIGDGNGLVVHRQGIRGDAAQI